MVKCGVVARFLQMPLVINRRRYDLARISDRAVSRTSPIGIPCLAIGELFDVIAEADPN